VHHIKNGGFRILKIQTFPASAVLENGALPRWRCSRRQNVSQQKQKVYRVQLSWNKVICIIIRRIAYQSGPIEY